MLFKSATAAASACTTVIIVNPKTGGVTVVTAG